MLVRSGDGERVVLHRRRADKLVFADTWDCWAGGVVGPGEDPADAAVRELAEELGITGAPLTPLPHARYDGRARALPRVHLRGPLGRPAAPGAHGDRLGGLGDARPSWSSGSPTRRAGRSRPTDARASNAGSPRGPTTKVIAGLADTASTRYRGDGMTTTRSTTLRELTIRSVVLGGLITLIFTAANVYLGLKVGLTFATAIPAAVISMAILRYFRGHSILENNIVQTIASAAGTLAAIIFVLPGLIMIGWWQGFPYWTDGGGVRHRRHPRRDVFRAVAPRPGHRRPTCPTRKAGPRPRCSRSASTPKGAPRRTARACAPSWSLRWSPPGSRLLAALKVISNEISAAFRLGAGGSTFGASLSLALIGVGHLVGVTVGAAMIVGLLISLRRCCSPR